MQRPVDYKIVDKPLPTGWEAWENKNLSMHRIIFFFYQSNADLSLTETVNQVRDIIRNQFKIRFWRGMAFSTIYHFEQAPKEEEFNYAFKDIDIEDQPKGTHQWCAIVMKDIKMVQCFHTWMAVKTSPILEALLQSYSTDGFEVNTVKKEKGKLLKMLNTIP